MKSASDPTSTATPRSRALERDLANMAVNPVVLRGPTALLISMCSGRVATTTRAPTG